MVSHLLIYNIKIKKEAMKAIESQDWDVYKKANVKQWWKMINEPNSINKGTGAGGATTNENGKKFERDTNSEVHLLNENFTKYPSWLSKTFEDKKVTFTTQAAFKKFIKEKFNRDVCRHPDEAFIVEFTSGRKLVIIIEKKAQNVQGSVDQKLWSSSSLKREYEICLGNDFEVYYGLCLNQTLTNWVVSDQLKYKTLRQILQENKIEFFNGCKEDYYQKLKQWFLKIDFIM
jgi:hypothetical protein